MRPRLEYHQSILGVSDQHLLGEASLKTRLIILDAGCSILMEITFIHTCGDQFVALQID